MRVKLKAKPKTGTHPVQKYKSPFLMSRETKKNMFLLIKDSLSPNIYLSEVKSKTKHWPISHSNTNQHLFWPGKQEGDILLAKNSLSTKICSWRKIPKTGTRAIQIQIILGNDNLDQVTWGLKPHIITQIGDRPIAIILFGFNKTRFYHVQQLRDREFITKQLYIYYKCINLYAYICMLIFTLII